MIIFAVRNVNEALSIGLKHFQSDPSVRTIPSRAGEVLELPCPVITHYSKPCERVLFMPERQANPFFHFFEALWMLAGRNDLEFIEQFNPRMREYSDGMSINGSAYGYRWREWFGHDQLKHAIRQLKKDPYDRRVVLQHWDGDVDGQDCGAKDLPCNTCAYLLLRDNKLQLTVSNRSNDMIWGAYGANAVHFSMLQEYIAGHLGCEVGSYYQQSNSLHVYTNNPVWKRLKHAVYSDMADHYTNAPHVEPFPMFKGVDDPDLFDCDLRNFFDLIDHKYRTSFFNQVVKPMYHAHKFYKDGDIDLALAQAGDIAASDWRFAAKAWLIRRMK